MPEVTIEGNPDTVVVDAMVLTGVASSKSEARRLVEGGGVKIGDEKVTTVSAKLADFGVTDSFVLHKGKKVHVKVVLK